MNRLDSLNNSPFFESSKKKLFILPKVAQMFPITLFREIEKCFLSALKMQKNKNYRS